MKPIQFRSEEVRSKDIRRCGRGYKGSLKSCFVDDIEIGTFNLRTRMNEISSSKIPEKFKEAGLLKLYHEMREIIEKTLKAIDKVYIDGRIEIKDYDEMT